MCGGLLVENKLYLSGLALFDFISLWSAIFVSKNYWFVFDNFGCAETRNLSYFSINLVTNLSLENSIVHKKVAESSFLTRRAHFHLKRPFSPCAPTLPLCHTKITELAPLELLTHFAKLTPTKYHILSPIISPLLFNWMWIDPVDQRVLRVLNARQPFR